MLIALPPNDVPSTNQDRQIIAPRSRNTSTHKSILKKFIVEENNQALSGQNCTQMNDKLNGNRIPNNDKENLNDI